MHNVQALIEQLREHGCRLTQQRTRVLQALCELEGHASAEAIHARIVLQQQDVDLSTVYRTLEMLRDLRILSQTDLGRGCAEYEIVTERPHHHLICLRCGRLTHLDHSYLAPVAEAIRQDMGFEAVLDHMAIFGLCHACRGESGGDCDPC
jgi:Fur family ferric uptake transcriptional regulator